MTLPQYYRTAKGNQALENRSVKLNSRQRALLLMIESRHGNRLSQLQLQQLATADNLALLLEHQLIAVPETAVPETAILETALPQQKPEARRSIQKHQPLVQDNPAIATLVPAQTGFDNAPAQTAFASAPAQSATSILPAQQPQARLPEAQAADLAGQQTVIAADLHSAAMVQATPVYLSFDDIQQLMMSSLRQHCGLLASALIKDIQHASSVGKLRMCQMRWVTTMTETRASSAQIAAWAEQINYSLNHVSETVASLPEGLTL